MIKKNLKKNINIIANSSKTLDHFSRSYIDYLNNLLLSIDSRKLNNLSKILLTARRNKGNIFVIGNGGSAATASSMANDLGFDIIKKTRTNKPFKFISLTDNSPVLTAISNDTGYENVFLNLLN